MERYRFQIAFTPKTEEEVELCIFLKGLGKRKSEYILNKLTEKSVDYSKIREIIKEELLNASVVSEIKNTEPEPKSEEKNITPDISEEDANLMMKGLSMF